MLRKLGNLQIGIENESAGSQKGSLITAIVVVAFLYAAAGRVGLLAAIPPGYVTAIWPSSGIALAAVLLRGSRIWPGIWLGSFAVNNWVYVSSTHRYASLASISAAALIAVGASLAALCGAFLLRRIAGCDKLFTFTRHVVGFAVVGVLGSCFISATIGSTSLWLVGLVQSIDYSRTWWTWWLGDAAGILVTTPLLLTWTQTKVKFRGRLIEASVLLLLLIATSSIAFGYQKYPLAFIVLPVLITAAIRFEQVGASTAIALAFFIGALYTSRGRGPFAAKGLSLNESLLVLGSFMLLTGFTILILAAVWTERERHLLEVAQEREHATSAEQQKELIQAYATTIEAENRRNAKQIQEAAELQLSMLPASMPEIPGLDVSAHMHSASQVGGDYYDILPMGKTPDFRSYLFCVADVAGKGLVASLLMSNFQSMLLTLIDESLPLAEIANRLSSLLQVVPRRSRYVTSVMVQLDVVTRVCHYVNAGHTSGILLRAEGELEWLSSTGFPIGMFADCTYQSEAFQLYSGSLVALFSDGFTDALDANGQEFGEGRLVDYLRRACGKPAKDIVEGAFDEINRFIGSAPQFDDITLLVFKSTV